MQQKKTTNQTLDRKLFELSSIINQKESFVTMEKEVKSEILKLMKEERINEFEAHGLRAEYVHSSSTMIVDSVKLKEEAPDLYYAYSVPMTYPERLDIKKITD